MTGKDKGAAAGQMWAITRQPCWMYKASVSPVCQGFHVVFSRVPDEALVTWCPGHNLNDAADSLIDDRGLTRAWCGVPITAVQPKSVAG